MKIDRLLGILMQLINKKKVTAKELADHYDVSVRTIQRDMDTLTMAGIPLYADVGKNGGYSLLDHYKLDKSFLKDNEMNILLKFLESLDNIGASKEINALYNKFQVMNSGIEHDEKLVIQLNPFINNDSFKRILSDLSSSIDSRRKVKLSYIDVHFNKTDRTINPYMLIMSGTTWYVYGYCELRMGFRMFKLNRIVDADVLNDGFERVQIPDERPWESGGKPDIVTAVTLKIDKRVHAKVTDVFDYQSFQVKDDHIVITIETEINEWFLAILMSLTPFIEILEPENLKHTYIQRLKSGIEKNIKL